MEKARNYMQEELFGLGLNLWLKHKAIRQTEVWK